MTDLHHSLRDLLAERRIGLASGDAEEFRASLDDFLSEEDATVGELNLLVDAVRLGAVSRMVAMVDAGGDAEAAIRESGMALARDRGSDDSLRACWALAVLGFAAGRVGDQTVRRYPRHISAPAPLPVVQSTPVIQPAPPTVGQVDRRTALAPPQGGPLRLPGPQRRSRLSWKVWLPLVLVLVLAATAGAAYVVLRPDAEPRTAAAGQSPSRTIEEPPERVRPGTILEAPGVSIPAASKTIAMSSATGGVRLAAFGSVDSVARGDEDLLAPAGGRLIAFRLAEWKHCESEPCRSWTRLDLKVEVTGATRRLPGGGPTFVVALPEGTETAELVYRDPVDGFRQSISLTTGRPTGDNITVLARPRSERTVRIARSFQVVDSVSPAFEGLTEAELTRIVQVRSAELFFTDARLPLADPGRAYLRVDADFHSPVDPVRYRFREELLAFTATDGTTFEAIDLDPGTGAEDRDVVFEVPGSLRGGTLTIGGTYSGEATFVNGVAVTITITVPRRPVKLEFRS
jgi:hypothetical protein